MRHLSVTGGLVALVDDDDYEKVRVYNWQRARNQRGIIYVIRKRLKTDEGMPSCVRLARVIMGATNGQIVDHINGDTLDNRKCNLRICTALENARNVSRRKHNRCRFKGVYQRSASWCARIYVDGKKVHLGSFASDVEAARAYDVAALQYFGSYARPNMPDRPD